MESNQDNAFVNFFKPKTKQESQKAPTDVEKLKEKKKEKQEISEEQTLDIITY
jgi:hypothetical protein